MPENLKRLEPNVTPSSKEAALQNLNANSKNIAELNSVQEEHLLQN